MTTDKAKMPEKARLLDRLRRAGFHVPDFVYLPPEVFRDAAYDELKAFLETHQEGYKVIARSAHPQEEFFKGGTFDSLETYADIGGIEYARRRMIAASQTAKRLSILRQQKFASAPEVDPDQMGVIVMPFIDGISVMAKRMGGHWEFGYCQDRTHKVQSDPYITTTPHDRRLLEISEDIQKALGFPCEIEYVISEDGDIHVVQAKDISNIELLDPRSHERSVRLDGIYRIRKRRNYRERPIYVLDRRDFYIRLIGKCEDLVLGCEGPAPTMEDILAVITGLEEELEAFALRHERFAVLGLSVRVSQDLHQIANHYLDELPEEQKRLSKALNNHMYKMDYFLAEADTLLTKDRIRVAMCTHDAYGIDSVRNPLWSAYWKIERHDAVVREFQRLGFRTGDSVGIEIDTEERPVVYRL